MAARAWPHSSFISAAAAAHSGSKGPASASLGPQGPAHASATFDPSFSHSTAAVAKATAASTSVIFPALSLSAISAAGSWQTFVISAAAAAHALAGVVAASAWVGGLGPKGPVHAAAIFCPSTLHLTAASAKALAASASVILPAARSAAMEARAWPHSSFISATAAAHAGSGSLGARAATAVLASAASLGIQGAAHAAATFFPSSLHSAPAAAKAVAASAAEILPAASSAAMVAKVWPHSFFITATAAVHAAGSAGATPAAASLGPQGPAHAAPTFFPSFLHSAAASA